MFSFGERLLRDFDGELVAEDRVGRVFAVGGNGCKHGMFCTGKCSGCRQLVEAWLDIGGEFYFIIWELGRNVVSTVFGFEK